MLLHRGKSILDYVIGIVGYVFHIAMGDGWSAGGIPLFVRQKKDFDFYGRAVKLRPRALLSGVEI
jgi:hypothetical protein